MQSLKPYRGYSGSVEYSHVNSIYHGRILDIGDLVNYQAESFSELQKEFQMAVDEYIECRKELHRNEIGT